MNRATLTASLAAAALAVVVGTANADTPRWNLVADAGGALAFIDQNSVAALGGAQSVWLLRNYPQTIELGNDPVTGTPWYPHRSVRIQYAVDCALNRLALNAWQMHSENFGVGAVVWADRNHGLLAYAAAWSEEEKAAIAEVCVTKTALR